MYYSDRESSEPGERQYDLVVRDRGETFDTNVTVLNNVRLNLDSQHYHSSSCSSDAPVKNVNIDNDNKDTVDDGAAAGYDVNLYPSHDKSNLNQRAYTNKAVKADLEIMIRNNLIASDGKQNNADEDDNDSVHKMKLNHSKNSAANRS